MKIKVVNKSKMPLPEYMTDGSACIDLCVSDAGYLTPGETRMFHTGLHVEIPKGYCIEIVERSSLHKSGLELANSIGIIDSDYRGEIKLPIRNLSYGFSQFVGGRVAQAMLKKVEPIEWVECESIEELGSTDRGDGGFGSTGTGIEQQGELQ